MAETDDAVGDEQRTGATPPEWTSLVGRVAEATQVAGLLGAHRLVTLVGVGGCGKTRLAMAVAGRHGDRWRDGVRFADLGTLDDAAVMVPAVAASCRVDLAPGRDARDALAGGLEKAHALVVLDTCEHLIEPVADLVDVLLRRCPGVAILATSREPLGVLGEAVSRVPPLQPDEAAQLFTERGRLVEPDFDIDTTRDDVDRLCARVDRLPLPIELAAAWIRAMTPAQIARSLDSSMALLAGGSRSAVPRHRTMAASIAWSHALLSDEEQVLFRRLAVFAGPFSADDAAAVCPDPRLTGDLVPDGILAGVIRLLDASLLVSVEHCGARAFRMLDTIRQFAEERLAEAGEVEALRDRQVDHCLTLVDQSAGDTTMAAAEMLDRYGTNVQAALGVSLAGRSERTERGRRLAAGLAPAWMLRGRAVDGLTYIRRALDLAPDDASSTQGRLWAGLAMMAMISGRKQLVVDAAARGADIAQACGDMATWARARALAAYPLFFHDFAACDAAAGEARAAGIEFGDGFARDFAGMLQGYSLLTRGRLDDSDAIAAEVSRDSLARGDHFCASLAVGLEMYGNMTGGRLARALDLGELAMDTARPLRESFATGTNASNAALAVILTGDLQRARRMLEPVVRSVERTTDVDVVGFMVSAGYLNLFQGDEVEATRWFSAGSSCVDVARLGRGWTAARALPGLADILRRAGRIADAVAAAADAVAELRRFDAPFELAIALDVQGQLARATEPRRARALHLEALELRHRHGLRLGYPDSLEALAAVHIATDRLDEGARLLAISDAARRTMPYARPLPDEAVHQRTLTALQEELGAERYEEATNAGVSGSIDEVVAGMLRGRGSRSSAVVGWASLTATELDVAALVADGLSNPDIASRLFMSRSTVKTHLRHVFDKLGVANRAELAAVAQSRRDLPHQPSAERAVRERVSQCPLVD